MKCAFCKKELPDQEMSSCPHCFAVWTPVKEGDKKEDGKSKTVLGRD